MIKNKRAEGYVRTAIMILIFCIGIAVFTSFLLAVNTIRISKRNTYKIIDGYVTEKSIEAFNSIKFSSDYIESLDQDTFIDYFCEYNGMIKNGNTLIAKTDNGYEKYKVNDLKLSYYSGDDCYWENTLKLQVEYVISVPISFGDFSVFNAEIPIKITSKLTDKFY